MKLSAQEIDPQNDHYTIHDASCSNCGWQVPGRHPLIIPKGETLSGTPCPRCGCKTLSMGWRQRVHWS